MMAQIDHFDGVAGASPIMRQGARQPADVAARCAHNCRRDAPYTHPQLPIHEPISARKERPETLVREGLPALVTDSKSCSLLKRLGGSNPPLSVFLVT